MTEDDDNDLGLPVAIAIGAILIMGLTVAADRTNTLAADMIGGTGPAAAGTAAHKAGPVSSLAAPGLTPTGE